MPVNFRCDTSRATKGYNLVEIDIPELIHPKSKAAVAEG